LKECGRTFGLGQTTTEYAMIVACVAIVVIVAYELLGQDINAMGSWQSIDRDLTGQ
jgi:Flp pilus assembly pilin Flp